MIDDSNLTKEQIIEGIKNNTILLGSLSDNFKHNKEIVIEFFKNAPLHIAQYSIEHISPSLRDDKEVALEVVKSAGWGLMVFSKRLQDDRDVVSEVIKQKTLALQHASERLRNDKELILEAVKIDSRVLKYVSERLKDDKDVVLEAVKENGYSLEYASNRLKNDVDLLEVLEKSDTTDRAGVYKEWYADRMEVLNNLRNQEDRAFMEKSITVSNTVNNKIKF